MAWSTMSRHKRGYGTAWNKLRLRILQRDKRLCRSCKRKGLTTVATQVDHIVPKARGGGDDETNLQSLCQPCHDLKTIEDAGGKPKLTTGADGWPV